MTELIIGSGESKGTFRVDGKVQPGAVLRVTWGERERTVTVLEIGPGHLVIEVEGRVHRLATWIAPDAAIHVAHRGGNHRVTVRTPLEDRLAMESAGGDGHRFQGEIKAHMPGKIVDVPVTVGDVVEAGKVLVVLEAMKMENGIKSPGPGRVRSIRVKVGDSIESGGLLLEMEKVDGPDA